MPARPMRTTPARAGALLLAGAAAVIAMMGPLLAMGLMHRSPGTVPSGPGARAAATVPAAGDVPPQARERSLRATMRASDPGPKSPAGAVAGAVLVLALAGWQLPGRARRRAPSDRQSDAQRNRGPPRRACCLA